MLLSFTNAKPPISQGTNCDHVQKLVIQKPSRDSHRKTDLDGVICAEGRVQKMSSGEVVLNFFYNHKRRKP